LGDGAVAIVEEFMSVPVVLRPEATKDTEEAIGYFDALRPGLGQTFLIQVQEVLLRVSGMPKVHGVVWRNVRAARLRRFTYVVYYRVHEDRVEVLAVIQGNRDTAVWRGAPSRRPARISRPLGSSHRPGVWQSRSERGTIPSHA
jgi:toxin ParE1/3/4